MIFDAIPIKQFKRLKNRLYEILNIDKKIKLQKFIKKHLKF